MTIKQECVRKTCVFTILGKTYPQRYALHIKFLSALRKRGYRVIAITEHGYPERLNDGNVESYPQIRDGIGVAYRQGLRLALERCECAAYSEPEKVSYVPEIWKTIRPLIKGNADLVVPKRTQASLRSYPIVQRQTETIGNEFFAHLVGSQLDVFFGPESIASGKAAQKFLDYKTSVYPGREDSHDAHIVPIMECVVGKLRVLSILVHYHNPREQLEIEHDRDSMIRRYLRLYSHTRCLLERYRQLSPSETMNAQK